MKYFSELLIFFGVFAIINANNLAPFQISVRLYNSYNQQTGGNFDLCNGAIIHESYVVTTAHCVYSHIIEANISHPYLPGMIYIVAGNFSSQNLYTRYVTDIIIHENYNLITLENDIAVLKLNEPLPLRNATDVKWIELEDKAIYGYENCFASFRNESDQYLYTTQLHVNVVDQWFCNRSYSIQRNNDICANYLFTQNSTCQLSFSQLQLNNDRGTPLVCNNRLTGLLSIIIPPDTSANATDCLTNHRTWGVYTRVDLFTKWIYSKIGVTSNFVQQSSQNYGLPYFNSQTPSNLPGAPLPPKKSSAFSIFGGNSAIYSLLLVVVNYLFNN